MGKGTVPVPGTSTPATLPVEIGPAAKSQPATTPGGSGAARSCLISYAADTRVCRTATYYLRRVADLFLQGVIWIRDKIFGAPRSEKLSTQTVVYRKSTLGEKALCLLTLGLFGRIRSEEVNS